MQLIKIRGVQAVTDWKHYLGLFNLENKSLEEIITLGCSFNLYLSSVLVAICSPTVPVGTSRIQQNGTVFD